MKLFHRTQTSLDDVLTIADQFFGALGLTTAKKTAKTRTFMGPLGKLELSVKAEGGHYTFIEASTDQIGESRLDKNVKRFFVQVHRRDDPAHALAAGY